MKKVLVTGAGGQLGSELQYLAPMFPQFVCEFVDRDKLDISNIDQIEQFMNSGKFDFLVNCAAYTAVDKAESESAAAEQINGIAPGLLATTCKKRNCKFIQISTDFVFDGKSSEPIGEDAMPNPISVYGATKLEGEKNALKENTDTLIIRTSWVYSSYGNNFVKTILRLCKERESLNVIYDQIGSPTYARDLARAIFQVMDGDWIAGVYHYSNEGVASWYDFAIAIRDFAGLKTAIQPIETSQYPTPAARPKFSLLNKAKVKQTFGLQIPYWRDSLKSCVELL